MFGQIMKVAADNSLEQMGTLEQVSGNVANLNTNAYKATRFEHYLTADNTVRGTKRIDASQGALMTTRRELDLGIEGDGYIPVTQTDGTVAYTRDGSFIKDAQGFLVTNGGDRVAGGIQIPANAQKILIQPDGTVQAQFEGQIKTQDLGKITLVGFSNPERLKTIDHNKLLPTVESGEAKVLTASAGKLRQGTLERANVNVFAEIDKILRMNASIISNLRIVRLTDDLYRQAVNLRQ